MFQEHRLLRWLTVEGSAAAALRRSPLSKRERLRQAELHLKLVGLESFAGAYPAKLSSGMAQRVAIAHALVSRPGFLLLHEPLGALDALTRRRLQGELKRIVQDEGITAVLVTHDVDEAVYLGNRVVVMHPHPWRVAAIQPVTTESARDRSNPVFIQLRDEIPSLLGVSAYE